MGKRGPKRTPTIELLRRGSIVGKRRAASELAIAPADALPVPPNLPPEGLPIWEKVAGHLVRARLVGVIDSESVYCYVEACLEFDRAVKELKNGGYTWTDDRGNVRKSPWISIKANAAERVKRFAAEFGLTPASRSNVKKDNYDGNKKENDPQDARPRASDFIKIPRVG